MSITAENDRRLIWPVVIGAAAALLLAAGGLAVLNDRGGGGGEPGASRGPGSPPPYGSVHEIKQADWKIDFKSVGLSRLSGRQRKRLVAQRPSLVTLVKEVYGALFLAPEELGKEVKADFVDPAARSFRRANTGLPKNSTRVRITRRVARLAIDRSSPTRATARIRILAKGSTRAGRFALRHTASLYMLRAGKTWKVIGFEVDQGPFDKRAADKAKQTKNRHAGDQDRPSDRTRKAKSGRRDRDKGRSERGDRNRNRGGRR